MPYKFNPFTNRLDFYEASGGGSGIQTINTISPDGGGDFTIESSDASITVTPIANGVDLTTSGGSFAPVSFSAYLTATQSSVTGDGTQYTPVFDGVLSNIGSAYNNTTGVFTAPATGDYLFNYIMCYFNAGVATAFIEAFVSGAPENYNFRATQATGANAFIGTMAQNGSISVHLTAGTTMQVTAAAFGTTKSVDISGGTLGSYAFTSMFSGSRVA